MNVGPDFPHGRSVAMERDHHPLRILEQSPPKRVEVPCHGWNCAVLSVPKDLRLPPPPLGMMR